MDAEKKEPEKLASAELTKLRCMQKYLLEEADFRTLRPVRKLRNAYLGELPRELFSEPDVLRVAVKVRDSLFGCRFDESDGRGLQMGKGRPGFAERPS